MLVWLQLGVLSTTMPQSSSLVCRVHCNLPAPLHRFLHRYVIGFVHCILPLPPRVRRGPLPLSGLALGHCVGDPSCLEGFIPSPRLCLLALAPPLRPTPQRSQDLPARCRHHWIGRAHCNLYLFIHN